MLGAAGVWVLCQVLGGRALQRIGLLPSELGDQLPPNGGPTGAAAPAGQAAVPGAGSIVPASSATSGRRVMGA